MKLLEIQKNGMKKIVFRCPGTEPGKMRKYLRTLGVRGLNSKHRSIKDFNAILIEQNKRYRVISEENPTTFKPGHIPGNATPLEPLADMSDAERNFWYRHESGVLTTDDVTELRRIRDKERQKAWEAAHFIRRTMYFRKDVYDKIVEYAKKNSVTITSVVELALDEFLRNGKEDDE